MIIPLKTIVGDEVDFNNGPGLLLPLPIIAPPEEAACALIPIGPRCAPTFFFTIDHDYRVLQRMIDVALKHGYREESVQLRDIYRRLVNGLRDGKSAHELRLRTPA